MSAADRGQTNSGSGGDFNSVSSLIAAAHELKSPLALIRQLSLSLEAGDYSESEGKQILRKISLTSERALRLTGDLTRSARINETLFDLEPVNVQQICENVVQDMKPMYRAYEKDVKLVTSRKPILMVANRDLVSRVLINFCDNALHNSDDYSTIEIKTRLLQKTGMVRLGVRDYGPAVKKDVISKVAGRLKGGSPVAHRPQSSGLGLYIASEFAAMMNGQVGVIRHRDGATFYIDLQLSSQLSLL